MHECIAQYAVNDLLYKIFELKLYKKFSSNLIIVARWLLSLTKQTSYNDNIVNYESLVMYYSLLLKYASKFHKEHKKSNAKK